MTSNPDIPPFIGHVETTVNALRLIYAARQGVIPRITRRLNDAERRTMIKSGAVFVFSVEESGIKRWTDGLLWSPSRIVGNFLVYREINERTSSRGSHRKTYSPEDSPSKAMGRRNSPEQVPGGYKGLISNHMPSDQGTFKQNGLIKKTITVTIEGSDLHLISYYTSEDIRLKRLKRPSSRADIMGLYMPPDIFQSTNFRVPPKMELGPDRKPRLVCEAEDQEPVDCKVEDIYQVPESPTWTTSVANSFTESSMYAGHGVGPSSLYARSGSGERWQADNGLTSPVGRQDLSWSPSGSGHSSSQSAARRRDTTMLSQVDQWPSLHSQTGRWQGDPAIGSNSMYLDRTRTRQGHPFEEGVGALRRENQGMSPTFSHRYPGHPGGREGASQRLHWQTRDPSDPGKDRRSSPHSGTSFTPSPTLPFASQGYHSASHSYSSAWSSTDSRIIGTLHPVSTQSGIPYDPSYAGSGSLSSPEDFTSVEDYGDA